MTERSERWSGILKTLGPGVLYAGAAIGGSHLVWSTRAGALYGFGLVWVVILVNVFKYPFFEFIQRYTAATGESVLAGYRRVGPWALWLFFAFAVVSSIANVAGVTVITAILANRLFGTSMPPLWWSERIIFVSMIILVVGHYALLDKVLKVIVSVLAISTVAAFSLAAFEGGHPQAGWEAPPVWDAAGIAFLLALMGWMPTPLDVGVWPSLWAAERRKQTGHEPTLREALIDFHIGYVGTGVLALFFLGLGALVMYGTGEDFGKTGIEFADRLFSLYTFSLGQWSFYVVAIAAFTCMLSTTITCVDAYPRTIHAALMLGLGHTGRQAEREDPLYWIIMALVVLGSLVVIGLFMEAIFTLLAVATVIAFLSAPILAVLNYAVIRHPHVPESARPPQWLIYLSWAGLLFLTAFSLLYLYIEAPGWLGY